MNFDVLFNNFENSNNELYPKIENIKQDYKFGKMIYDSFSGSHSELTTILQYIYENMEEKTPRELKNALIKIAIEEMTHLKLLGNLLVKFGFTPYYMNSRGYKWCSDNVKYKFNCIDEMLEYNIKGEKGAIEEYRRLMGFAQDKCIKDLFARIIDDEENHIKIFSALLTKK